jgi:Protein of unknown function (DUF3089)
LKLLIKLFFLFCLFAFVCCRPAYKSYRQAYEKEYQQKDLTTPDYSDLKYWAAHPWKQDPSDSIPQPLLSEARDSLVDVFFLHPTTLTSKKTSGVVWNADINDAELNAKTDYSSILYQASVFNGSCRVFAPRYRQAHIYSFFSSDTINTKKAFAVAYEDVKNAFIIASHSQGTLHAAMLMKEFFENKPLQKQLVCAYLVGLVLPKNYYTNLSSCSDPSSTGCFTGWRTYRKNFIPTFVEKENNGSWVINPLSWVTDTIAITRDKNKGAVLYNFNKIIPGTNGAMIHKGILWVERPKFPGGLFYWSKNYHPGDINLFYMNIRQNVKTRIAAYFQLQAK